MSGGSAPGRRRHEADPAVLVQGQGGDAGREPAQDVPRHGKRYPCHPDQAGRPSAQYAYAAVHEAGEAERKSP